MDSNHDDRSCAVASFRRLRSPRGSPNAIRAAQLERESTLGAKVYLPAKYPDDREASVFYALALDATWPPTDNTYANLKKAGATCSGSSSWTKCRAPGIKNSSEPGRNSWNVRATPLFREQSASPKMIPTGRPNSFSLGIICVRDWTMGNKSSFRRKKAGRALGAAS